MGIKSLIGDGANNNSSIMKTGRRVACTYGPPRKGNKTVAARAARRAGRLAANQETDRG
jgi:hypothetical protein